MNESLVQVLLIRPHSNVSNVLPPLGLGYLSSALRKHGISARIVDCHRDSISIPDVVGMITDDGVKVVGVTCCSNDHFWVDELARELDASSDVRLVVGGPHATGLSTRLLRLIPRIDFVIRSEGEYSFPELVRGILDDDLGDGALASIPNLVWSDSSGGLIENPVELPDDLDALGRPDWTQMDPREYAQFVPHGGFARARPVAQLIATRGCPFSCRYCAASLMNGKKMRRRSPESIVEEIEYLTSQYGVREIHFEDDNFTFDKDYVVNVCTAIRKKGVKLSFGLPNGVRADGLDREILEELRRTGFYFLSIGIESGSPAVLKAMGKRLDLQRVKEALRLARRCGFRVKGFLMLGYPGETRSQMLETIRFARSLDLDQAFFSIYIPLPGTAEFRRLEQEGRINVAECSWEDWYTGKFSEPPYVPDGITSRELEKMVSFAYRSFYLRFGVLLRMARNITATSQVRHLMGRAMSLMGIRS